MAERTSKYLTHQTILFDKEIGTRLQYIMRFRGEGQVAFARLLGVSQAQVSAVFNGKATFLRKKNTSLYVTSKELVEKLGVKAWRYLNSGEHAEDFAPYRYSFIDDFGNVVHSAKPRAGKEREES